jgi:hypothetical protein
MRTRILIAPTALAVLTAAALPAGAQARGPKLYSVSLSGSTRTELTSTREADPPSGCQGTGTETNRFVGGASLSPKPTAAPVASYGRLRFNSRLSALTASASQEITGNYTVDPFGPGSCNFTPSRRAATCTFSSQARGRAGAKFALLPHGRFYDLYYNSNTKIVTCTPDDLFGEIFGETVLTKLRVSAVRGLGVGRSVSASGTATAKPNSSSTTGGETTRYTLRVRRVR